MVEHQFSKLMARVRFPYPAPNKNPRHRGGGFWTTSLELPLLKEPPFREPSLQWQEHP